VTIAALKIRAERAFRNRWFFDASPNTVVFWHIRENVWADETQTRDLRSVGATERTNRNSLTAFGDIPDARNATAPARLGSVVMCAEAVSRN